MALFLNVSSEEEVLEQISSDSEDEIFFPDDCKIMEIHLKLAFKIVTIYYIKQLRLKQDLKTFFNRRSMPVEQLNQELVHIQSKIERSKAIYKSIQVMTIGNVHSMFDLTSDCLLMNPSTTSPPSNQEMLEAKRISRWCDVHKSTFCVRCLHANFMFWL